MPEKMSKAKILKRAKRCFDIASETEHDQRARELEDLKFQVPEMQWDEGAKKERQGGDLGGQTGQIVPPRPMLSISLLTQPQQLIRNQAMNAHLGVEIHPVSEMANQEVAEVKQGLYRRIERDSNAQVARLWALDRAMQAGRGWYRINTQWDEDGDNPFDQEIVIERILQQENVYMDPTAEKADCSDANWCIFTTMLPVEEFKEQYPKAKEVPVEDSHFKDWMGNDPNWVKQTSKGEKAVRVAEYWVKETEEEEVSVGEGEAKRVRQRPVTRVYCYKVTAREVLEEELWPGRYLPFVPVWGRELQPFEGDRRWEGIVRQARDGQRLFNYAASNLVERMAMEPKAPWLGAEGQFEGHEEEFTLANVRNVPYLEYKPTTLEGQPVPPPQRAQLDSTGMSLALQALIQGKQFVQSATAVYEPSLGDLPAEPTAQSGRAIIALQQQSDAGTSHFLQNMARISMNYEALAVLDLMPRIYDRPGRVVQILGGPSGDDKKAVMLNKPFVPGPNGQPMPIPAGMPPPQEAKAFDLTRGKYAVSISVGKSYQTRLQEGQQEIGAILEKNPQWAPIIGPTYFKFRDFPGAKEIAEDLRIVRNMQFPALDQEEGMTLPKAQSMIAAMSQKMKEMEGVIGGLQQEVATDRAKQEATMAKAQMDNQTKEVIAKMETMVALQKELIKAQAKTGEGDASRTHDEGMKSLEMVHEKSMQDDQQSHDMKVEILKAAVDRQKIDAQRAREDNSSNG